MTSTRNSAAKLDGPIVTRLWIFSLKSSGRELVLQQPVRLFTPPTITPSGYMLRMGITMSSIFNDLTTDLHNANAAESLGFQIARFSESIHDKVCRSLISLSDVFIECFTAKKDIPFIWTRRCQSRGHSTMIYIHLHLDDCTNDLRFSPGSTGTTSQLVHTSPQAHIQRNRYRVERSYQIIYMQISTADFAAFQRSGSSPRARQPVNVDLGRLPEQ
ncbi:hypothetical protein Moror_9504 [Moniliophthora roreri MCA 2997]|uniref:Uncharacterized protein n=1 Tax=Moniliophthora roreri (strain MCA 2997) TaxID=1381753 RepID=V2X0F6_MONRO|nr:hypothetical protein Moror_9504 [Moniliophthora roreri MCA 2997]